MEQLNSTTWKHIQKDDWRERLEVVIGDDKQPDFKPQIKIQKWDNEVNASFRLVDDEKGTPIIKQVGEKISYIKPKKDLFFYNLKRSEELKEGGYEFEVVLKEKPSTNKLQFTIRTKGLKFYYQPPLDEEEKNNPEVDHCTPTDCYDKDGNVIIHRPENVVGSYAVYHESKAGDYSKMGKKNYRAGKAFHIYRPKITDANGNWTWGKLNIDEKKGILTIEIDQNFLDKAVYPVKIDPTFGYTTIGGSTYSEVYEIDGSKFLGASGNGTSITVYEDSPFPFKFALYDTSGNLISNGYTSEGSPSTYPGWFTLSFVTAPVLSAQDYVICWWQKYTVSYGSVYYDTGDTNQGYYVSADNSLDYTAYDPVSWNNNNKKYSIYCTYTAAGQDVTVTLAVQTITSSQPSPTVTAQKNVTISTATQTLASALLAITLSLGAGIGVNAQTGTVSQLSPTVSTQKQVTVTPNTQTASFAQQSPTITAQESVSVSVSVQTISSNQLSPTIATQKSVSISANTQTITGSQLSPTVSAQKQTTITPSVQSISSSQPAISVNYGYQVSVSAETAAFSQLSPTITTQKNVSISAGVQTITANLLSPTLLIQGQITITPNVQTISSSQPAISVNYDYQISVSTETISLSQLSPTVSTEGGVSISVGVQTITSSLPSISVVVAGNITITSEVQVLTTSQLSFSIITDQVIGVGIQELTFSIFTSDISGGAVIDASVQVLTFSVQLPTISTQGEAAISAGVQELTFSIPDYTISTELFNPYKLKRGIYSKRTSPYISKKGIYSKGDSPYKIKRDIYSKV